VRSIVSSDRVGRSREKLPTYSILLFAVSHLMVSSVNVPALAGIRTYIGALFHECPVGDVFWQMRNLAGRS
jgi:hypothetical protein